MDPQDEIFLNAREMGDPTERAAYLDQACGTDAALRWRVEELLQDVDGAKDFFGVDDVLPGMVAPPLTEGPGTVIGRYKLLQKIGEGGMGVVYMSEQREPVVRRVALKIIKLGMDTRQVLGRFEAERQALALMDHPNIAKILDGGATDTGRPYFVMDLVQGLPISRFCDEAKLSTRDRLDLFLEVCSAIQHAHQKGIIHRDIKPANILVTLHGDKPVPKVIDFGIAKAMQGRLTEKTPFTQFQHFIGTPAYMSPEQASLSGLDVDTRSDIYGLGVLLYELLTGRTPLDEKELMKAGFDEMRRTIREREPLRPSTRLSSLAAEDLTTTAQHRRIEAPRLISTLRGDLDWIVMKALEKDRARRYETANGLATDLKRHLNNEPVIARPPSQLYRVQKMVRRNRLACVAIAAITAVLLLAVVVSTWQAVRATRAEQEQNRLRQSEAKQRQEAEANERKAQAAQTKETQLRQQSDRRAYASDMNRVQRALEMNDLRGALTLLNRHRPMVKTDHQDLRGWEWRYLWNQCQSDADSVLGKVAGHVTALSVSHDGAWLAVASGNAGVSLWDLATRQNITNLPASGHAIRAAFSPQERILAYSSVPAYGADSEGLSQIHLWNGITRQPMRTLMFRGRCYGLAFSSEGRTLIASSETPGNRIILWRVADGAELASYEAPQKGTSEGTPFAVTRDFIVAAHATENDEVRVLDLATGQEKWKRKVSDDYVMALEFSPDGKTLASGVGIRSGQIYFWNVASGELLGSLDLPNATVGHLLFWPDGKRLAAACGQTIGVWDVTDPAHARLLYTLRGQGADRITLLPDNITLASGSGGSIYLWNTGAKPRERKRLTLPVHAGLWRFAPDSQSLVIADNQGRVARWQGSEFQNSEVLVELGANVDDACLSADAQWLAASWIGGKVRVWNLHNRTLSCEFTVKAKKVGLWHFMDGGTLMVVHRDENSLHQWDLTTRREVRSWPSLAGEANRAFSPDGQWCLTSIIHPDNTGSSLLNLTTGRETHLDRSWHVAAAFSPDGKLFALGGWQSPAQFRETSTQRKIGGPFGGKVWSLAFSPDIKRVATGEGGRDAVKVWDVETREDLLALDGQGSLFGSTAFSPDGNILGSSNWRGVFHLWPAPTWGEIDAAEKSQTK